MLQVSKHSGQEVKPHGPNKHTTEIAGLSFTDGQALYIRSVCEGIAGPKAAELAGFAFPQERHFHLSRDPRVQQAIASEIHRQVVTQGAPQAFKRAMELITSESTPPGIAWKVSQWFMETAGIRPQKDTDSREGQGRALEDLTLAELEAIASQARKRLETAPVIQGQARTVEQHKQQQTSKSEPIEQAAKPTMAGADPLG